MAMRAKPGISVRLEGIEHPHNTVIAIGPRGVACWKTSFLLQPRPESSWRETFRYVRQQWGERGRLSCEYSLVVDPGQGYSAHNGIWQRIVRFFFGRPPVILEITCRAGKSHLSRAYAEAERLIAAANEAYARRNEQSGTPQSIHHAESIRLNEALRELKGRAEGKRPSFKTRRAQARRVQANR